MFWMRHTGLERSYSYGSGCSSTGSSTDHLAALGCAHQTSNDAGCSTTTTMTTTTTTTSTTTTATLTAVASTAKTTVKSDGRSDSRERLSVMANAGKPIVTNIMDRLPPELQLRVLDYLSHKDLVNCAQVCKKWKQMSLDGWLWRNLNVPKYAQHVTHAQLEAFLRRTGRFLRTLNLRGCMNLTHGTLATGVAANCSNLENLNLCGMKAVENNALKQVFGKCTKLECLHISGGSVTNDTIELLRPCKKIRKLHIRCAMSLSYGISLLPVLLVHLEELNLSGCVLLSDDTLGDLSALSSLRSLAIANCPLITNKGIANLFCATNGHRSTPPALAHLNLSGCSGLTDDCLVHVAVGCSSSLMALELSGCRHMTDRAVSVLVRTCKKIAKLDLEDCDITDTTLTNLAASLRDLQQLTLSFCKKLTDDGVASLVSGCSRLEILLADNCPDLTDRSLDSIISLQHLRILDVRDCSCMSASAIRDLRKKRPELKVKYFDINDTASFASTNNQRNEETSGRTCIIL